VQSSHVILEKEGFVATLSVPVHKGKNVKRGTLRDLIRDAELSVEEFLKYV
jgi:predicted RNA binding protein YcfA (HicA-like mRNA interferase family)